MRGIIYIVLIVVFACPPFVFAEDLDSSGSKVVGTVTEEEPTRYAIVKIDGGKKKIFIEGDIFYSKRDITNCLRIVDIKKDMLILKNTESDEVFIVKTGESIPLEETDLVFEKSVESDLIEYRYNEAEGSSKVGLDDFSVMGLEEKIVLEKDYRAEDALALPESEEVGAEKEYIKAGLFEKIEVKETGDGVWSVDNGSAKEALSNVERSLVSVIKRVEPRFRFGEGPSLRFNSELGVAELNRDGFLIQNLAVASLVERVGLKKGDLIKSLNGQPVNSLYGIYNAYMNVKANLGVQLVRLDIVRDGKKKALIYRMK